MQGLFLSRTGPLGIDVTRFRIDAGFDFSECADRGFCSSNCNISSGAQKLAQYIANANPPGDIVLGGFSLGGLIARDMMANDRLNLNGRKVAAVVTLGTPNLGYPYTFVDTSASCTPLVQQIELHHRNFRGALRPFRRPDQESAPVKPTSIWTTLRSDQGGYQWTLDRRFGRSVSS